MTEIVFLIAIASFAVVCLLIGVGAVAAITRAKESVNIDITLFQF